MSINDSKTAVRNPRRAPELTRQEILDAATAEFADRGPMAARIDVIASKTNTSKRMIYYYFNSKAGLYTEVLERAYVQIRRREIDLHPEDLEPEAALRILTRETIHHFERNSDSVRIIAYENLQCRGTTISGSPEFLTINEKTITILENILERGRASGVFRDDPRAPSAIDVHQVLSAMALNRIEHRDSFMILFGRDMLGTEESVHIRQIIEDSVLRLVLKEPK